MWPFKNKRKNEFNNREIHELPELPPLPDLNHKYTPKMFKAEIKDELPPLPSFQSSPAMEEISPVPVEYRIKEPSKEYISLPKQKTKIRELQEISKAYKPIIKEISPTIKTEPVFVRIDKYQQAVSQFQEIKKRLAEIDDFLRNIREIKTREETELQQWEQEIQDAKSKLNSIDRTIFNKLEE